MGFTKRKSNRVAYALRILQKASLICCVLLLALVDSGIARAAASVVVVDTANAQYSDVTVANDGLARISYLNAGNTLKYARCLDVTCSTSNIAVLDAAAANTPTSIVVGSDGFARIAYAGSGNTLKVAICNDDNCSAPTLRVIVAAGSGYQAHIVMGTNGYPVVSYFNSGTSQVALTACNDALCASVSTTVIATTSGLTTSTAAVSDPVIASDGYPRIAYKSNADTVMYMACGNAMCSSGNTTNTVETIASSGLGKYVSLALDSSGNARIVYQSSSTGFLRYVHCTDGFCSAKNFKTVDNSGTVQYTSIVLDSSGNARISYQNATLADAKYARCADADCTSSSISTIESTGTIASVGTSITMISGNAVITYNNQTSTQLKYFYEGAVIPPTISAISPTYGGIAGGDSVTITGTNFTPSTTLTIGGVSATPTFVNSTTLTAITPAHAAGAVDVVVTESGMAATLAAGFTYYEVPHVVSVSPVYANLAGGPTITISGSNFDTTSTVYVDGSPVTKTLVNSSTINITAPSHAPGKASVTVNNAGIAQDTLTNAITYLPNIAFSTSPLTISATQPGLITIEARNAGGTPVTMADDITLSLTTTSGGGAFAYNLTDGIWTRTSITLPAGQSSISFYYRDSVVGTPTVRVTKPDGVISSQVENIASRYRMRVSGISDPISSGTPSSVTVQAVDYNGTPTTDYTGTVHFTSDDGTAILPQNFTFTTDMHGIHTFVNGVTLRSQGEKCVTVTDTVSAIITGAQCNITVTAPAPGTISKLAVITPPQSFPSDGHSSVITVQTQDATNTPIAVGSDTTIYVYSSSATGRFSSDGITWGSTASRTLTIPAGTSSVNVYFKDPTAGTPTLTFRDEPAPGADILWTNTTQIETVGVGVPHSFSMSSIQTRAGTFVPVTINLKDSNSINTTTLENLPVYLTSDSATSLFSVNADGSGASSSLSTIIPAGYSSVTVYFTDTVSKTENITASDASPADGATGLVDDVKSATVLGADAVRLEISGATSVNVGAYTNYSVTAYDTYGNVATFTQEKTIALATDSTGGQFYDVPSGNQITSKLVPAGSATTSAYYYDTKAGTSTITASNNSIGSDTHVITVAAGALTKTIFNPSSQSIVAGEIAPLQILSTDAYGNPVNTPTDIVMSLSVSSGSFSLTDSPWVPITSATIPSGQHSVNLFYKNTTRGTYTINTNDGTPLVDGTAQVTVRPAALYRFVITTAPSSGTVTQSTSAFTLAARDIYGNNVVAASDMPIYMYSTSSEGVFTVAGGTWGNSITMLAGTSTIDFFYKDNNIGSPTITASDQSPLDSPDTGIVNASVSIAINDFPPDHLTITTAPQTVIAGRISGVITIQARKANGVPAILSSDLTVNLASHVISGNSGTKKFTATGDVSAPAITTVNIPSGASSVDVYYTDTGSGIKNLSFTPQDVSVTSVNQQITINSDDASAMNFVTAPQTIYSMAISSQYRVTFVDQYGNNATLSQPTTISLATSCSSGEFSTQISPSWQPVSSIQLPTGTQDFYFYYKGIASGSCQLSTSATGMTPGTQTVTVTPLPVRIGFSNATRTIERGQLDVTYTVTLYDADGNVATTPSPVTVYLTSSSPSGILSVPSVIIGANQSSVSFTYNDLTLGTYTIYAKDQQTGPDTALIDGSQDGTVITGEPTKLKISPSGSSQRSGDKGHFSVELVNQYGYPAASSHDITATLSTTASTGEFYAPTENDPMVPSTQVIPAGSTGFDFWYRQTRIEGTTQITASAATLSNGTATVSIMPLQAAKLSLSLTTPTPFISGQPLTAIVGVTDIYGNAVVMTDNLLVYLHTTATSSTLPATVLIEAGTAQKEFGFKQLTVGSAVVTASDNVYPDSPDAGLVNAELTMTCGPGTPGSLSLTTDVTNITAGQRTKIDVTLLNEYNSPVNASGDLSIDLSTTSLSGGYYLASSGGSTVTSVTLPSGASTVSVWYSQTAAGGVTLTGSHLGLTDGSLSKNVKAGAVSKFEVTSNLASLEYGQNATITVTQQDSYGNPVVTGNSRQIFLGTNSTTAQLPGTAVIPGDVSNVNVSFSDTTTGTWRVTAADAPLPESPDLGIQNGYVDINVTPGAITGVKYADVPTQMERGSVISLKLSLVNSFGAVVPAIADTTVYVTSNKTSAQFGSSATGPWGVTSATILAGQNYATIYYKDDVSLGTATLTVSDVSSPPEHPDTGLTNGTSTLTMVSGDAVELVYTVPPVDQIATHTSGVVTVEARNRYGLPAVMSLGKRIYLNATGGFMEFAPSASGPWGATSVMIGVGQSQTSFVYRASSEGAYTIIASDVLPFSPDTGWTDASRSINITRQTPDHFYVSNISTPQRQGTPSSAVVVAMDSDNYPISWYNGTVNFTSSDPAFTILPAPYTFIPSVDAGSHTFTNDVAFGRSGTKTVTVTDSVSGISGFQDNIIVNGVPADTIEKLSFIQPSPRLNVGVNAVSGEITLQSQNVSGLPVNAGTGGLPTHITGSGTGRQFATSPTGPWSSDIVVTIPEGYSFTNFYYRSSVVGPATISATDWVSSVDSASITNADLQVAVGSFYLNNQISIQTRNYAGTLVTTPFVFSTSQDGTAIGKATAQFSAYSSIDSQPYAVDWATAFKNNTQVIINQTNQTSSTSHQYNTPEFVAHAGDSVYSIQTTASDGNATQVSTVNIPISAWIAETKATAASNGEVEASVQSKQSGSLSDAARVKLTLLTKDLSQIIATASGTQVAHPSIGVYTTDFQINNSDSYVVLSQLFDSQGNITAEDLSDSFATPQAGVQPVLSTTTPTAPGSLTPPNEVQAPQQQQTTNPSANKRSATTKVPGGETTPSENVAQFFKSLLSSPVTKFVFPVVLLGLAGLMAAVLLWAVYRELRHARAIMAIIKRDKELESDKTNFIGLAAHYLRTPVTLISWAVDSLKNDATIDQGVRNKAGALSSEIKQSIDKILKKVEQDRKLKNITAPDTNKSKLHIYTQPIFWLPIVLSIVITVAMNMLLATVGNQQIGGIEVVEQVFVVGVIALVLYSVVRERFMSREKTKLLEAQQKAIKILDNAKNKFVEQTVAELHDKIIEFNELRSRIPGNNALSDSLSEGISRLQNVINEFQTLVGIKTGNIAISKATATQLLDSAFSTVSQKLQAKNLKIEKIGQSPEFYQDQSLLNKVITSVLDNAAEYSTPGGKITINTLKRGKATIVKIANQGTGFAKDPSKMFGMFERGAELEDFTHAGMGLNLYLDKVIMNYLGGSIMARNIAGGAEVTITV